jgi:hypothetical protein
MSTIEQMFGTHPRPVGTEGHLAAECVRACFECVEICTACADACIAEADTSLGKCIRLNLDCADVCDVTGRLLARPAHTDAPMLRAQLEACALACRACGDECARHRHMEHCRICADACERCASICVDMQKAIVP